MFPRIFDIIAGVVTAVWAVSVIVGMIDPAYQGNPAIYGLMTGIIGAYATAKVIGRNGKDDRS